MYIYEITVKKDGDGAFVGIRLGDEEYFDFLDWNDNNEEVYTLETTRNIDRQLDLSEGVRKYTVWDGHGNEA